MNESRLREVLLVILMQSDFTPSLGLPRGCVHGVSIYDLHEARLGGYSYWDWDWENNTETGLVTARWYVTEKGFEVLK